MQNNYDFPVALQPIYLADGKEIKNKKAVVRTDSMDTLGVVSNDYGLVKHNDVIDTFRDASRDFGIDERISVTNNGGNLFYEMLFPKVEAEIQKGDIVRMRMIIKNSYNGMNSLHIVFGAMRLVCLNGMVVGADMFKFTYRHTKHISIFDESNSLDAVQIRENLQQYMGLFSKSMEQMTAMTQKSVYVDNALFDKEKIALPQYLLAEAKESFEAKSDVTLWGYYNSLTYAITHKMKKESPAMSIQYSMEALRAAKRAVVL